LRRRLQSLKELFRRCSRWVAACGDELILF
jgi:hypothetical protein